MDFVSIREKAPQYIKKYRYCLLILLLGLVLLLLPEREEQKEIPQPAQVESSPDLQTELAALLSRVEGAGKVEVLLTEAAGEQRLYQTDEDSAAGENSRDLRRDTVLVTDSDRQETGLIRQVLPPSYRGALILCQGADSPRVKLAMVEAVMGVTGLSSDAITVLKMK